MININNRYYNTETYSWKQKVIDMQAFTYLMIFQTDDVVFDYIQNATEKNKSFYNMKQLLTGITKFPSVEVKRNIKNTDMTYLQNSKSPIFAGEGTDEEILLQQAIITIYKNWKNYKDLPILQTITEYCIKANIPYANQKDTKWKQISYAYSDPNKQLTTFNLFQLLIDVTDPTRDDTSTPNPKFDETAQAYASRDFRMFTDKIENEIGISSNQQMF